MHELLLKPLIPGTIKQVMRVEFYSGLLDGILAFGVGIIILLINQLWEPFKRGFFCDDESIMYPHHDGTIPSSVLYGVGFSLNILSFVVIEAVILRRCKTSSYSKEKQERPSNWIQAYFCATFNVLLPFLYGAAVVQLITDIAKYSVGRLRPHFLDVCKPDYNKFNCSDNYITEDVCTGDPELIKHARLSFPSGHASFSMYAMIFLALYYQSRLTWRKLLLLRPLLQLFVFCLAYYTGLSRIYDYKHHWSDVLVGDIFGVIVAIITVLALTDLFKKVKVKDTVMMETDGLDGVTVSRPITKM